MAATAFLLALCLTLLGVHQAAAIDVDAKAGLKSDAGDRKVPSLVAPGSAAGDAGVPPSGTSTSSSASSSTSSTSSSASSAVAQPREGEVARRARPGHVGRAHDAKRGRTRTKRGWVWNQFFVLEEYMGNDPLHVGKLHSDSDKGDGSVKYILSGDGAGTLFVVDDRTGDVHATRRLDREEQAYYTLTAQAIDRRTGHPMEPPSEFIVKVQDVNDNEPRFLEGPYRASVPEMANVGTPVIRVTATDADDPTYGSSARVVYSLLEGHPYFSVDPHTGEIRTALPNMDREAREEYRVVIQGKDMGGHQGGLSGTTTVTISLSDVNDNPPKFARSTYPLSVSEAAGVRSVVGRIRADDADVGENAAMAYTLIESDAPGMFDVTTDSDTQEAVITLKKPLDFENRESYTLRVQAANTHVDSRYSGVGSARGVILGGAGGGGGGAPLGGPFRDTALVRVAVKDEDEPPVFGAGEYRMEVPENGTEGAYVGSVSARDPDRAKLPVRYYIDRNTDFELFFNIEPNSGALSTARALDREASAWHNLSVFAQEEGNVASKSRVRVSVRVTDVNDNAPAIAAPDPPDATVCENARPGKLIQTIGAVDRDEPLPGQRFFFSLSADNPNFTIVDNGDNTAGLVTRRHGYRRRDDGPHLVPVAVSDGGSPSLTGTGTLTVRVCACDAEGAVLSCTAEALALPAGLSPKALIAMLACLLLLLIIVVLCVTLRRRRKEPLMAESEGDVRETVVSYDDEGGGEEDTEAFDIAALKRSENGDASGRRDVKPAEPQLPPGARRVWDDRISPGFVLGVAGAPSSGSGSGGIASGAGGDMGGFLLDMLRRADGDPQAPPYDSLQAFAYEGQGSLAGSLSSLESRASSSGAGADPDADHCYDYLANWGPRFGKLAGLYATVEGKAED
ncbi:cadherin-7-like [Petromyzon marinus]|uniref:cadherin-7-like n=1 Tax=Petromyzon marinus TaxID=7757 RepID=UPI003F6FC0E2